MTAIVIICVLALVVALPTIIAAILEALICVICFAIKAVLALGTLLALAGVGIYTFAKRIFSRQEA